MRHVSVASIRSCHGKDIARLLEFIKQAQIGGCRVYENERTGAWLKIQKHMPETSELAKEVQERLRASHCSMHAVLVQ